MCSQLNHSFLLGVKEVGGVVEARPQIIWSLLERDKYYPSCPIIGLSSNNYKLYHCCEVLHLYKLNNNYVLIDIYEVKCRLKVTINLSYN